MICLLLPPVLKTLLLAFSISGRCCCSSKEWSDLFCDFTFNSAVCVVGRQWFIPQSVRCPRSPSHSWTKTHYSTLSIWYLNRRAKVRGRTFLFLKGWLWVSLPSQYHFLILFTAFSLLFKTKQQPRIVWKLLSLVNEVFWTVGMTVCIYAYSF